jgi:hypothetical protein
MKRIIIGLCLAVSAAANAGVVIQVSNDSFGNSQDILFGGSGLANNGPLVQGRTEVTGEVFDFRAGENIFGSGNDLFPSDGALRAVSVDTAAKFGFENLIYRMRLDSGASGMITFSAETMGEGQHIQSFSLSDGDTFRIYGTGGTRLSGVSFVSTADIERIDHIAVGTQTVPEPATFAAVGLGIAAVLRTRRRRRLS